MRTLAKSILQNQHIMHTNPIKTTLRGGDSAYSAPTLELLEIAVERGFGASDENEDSADYGYDGEGNDNGEY